MSADWLVVLDLHGTLVESDEEREHPKARPFLKRFLTFLFHHVKAVAIWTATDEWTLQEIYNVILKPILRSIGGNYDFVFMFSGDRETLSRSRMTSSQWESRSSAIDG